MTLKLVEIQEGNQEYLLVDRAGRNDIKHDFKKDGKPARFAEGFPKTWGSEEKKIQYPQNPITAAAVSHDERFIAVAVTQGVQVFDTDTFSVVATLRDTAELSQVFFQPTEAEGGGYVLLTQSVNYFEAMYRIVCWRLNEDGRRPKRVNNPDDAVAAANAVVSHLEVSGWKANEPVLQSIQAEVLKTVEKAGEERLLDEDQIFDGQISNFDRTIFSNDGKRLLYFKEKAPFNLVIVRDIASGKDVNVLEGHIQSVTSAVFSPDDKYIASAAWHETLKLWDAKTGKLLRTFGPTGGQNWIASFSPDSKHVLVSTGGREPCLWMWKIDDARAFPKQLGPFPRWARTVAWRPDGSCLAAGSLDGKLLVLDEYNTALQTWEATSFDFLEIQDATWFQGGRKLAFKPGDGPVEMYDFETNLKWRWGPGPDDSYLVGFWVNKIFELKKQGWLGSLDQDGVLRFWEMPQ